MKSVVFLLSLLLLTLSLAMSDKEIIQQTLNGVYEENNLEDPETIVECIDDDSAHKIVDFTGKILQKAANGTLGELLQIPKMMREFAKTLNPDICDCLKDNEEVDDLAEAYNLTDADPVTVEKKVISFVTTHYSIVHRWMGDLNENWKGGNYYTVGKHGAVYAHTVLDGMKRIPSTRMTIKGRQTPLRKNQTRVQPKAKPSSDYWDLVSNYVDTLLKELDRATKLFRF